MYVRPNYASKKLLKDAVEAGDTVEIDWSGPGHPADGVMPVEGPHYPQPHKWTAQVKVEGGRVVRVIS